MQLNLALDYVKPPIGEDKQPLSAAALSRLLFGRLVETKYERAMPRNESRMWARVQDQFAKEADAIEIDGSQLDFLTDLADKTDLPPLFSSWLWTLRDYLESAKKDIDKQKAA